MHKSWTSKGQLKEEANEKVGGRNFHLPLWPSLARPSTTRQTKRLRTIVFCSIKILVGQTRVWSSDQRLNQIVDWEWKADNLYARPSYIEDTPGQVHGLAVPSLVIGKRGRKDKKTMFSKTTDVKQKKNTSIKCVARIVCVWLCFTNNADMSIPKYNHYQIRRMWEKHLFYWQYLKFLTPEDISIRN